MKKIINIMILLVSVSGCASFYGAREPHYYYAKNLYEDAEKFYDNKKYKESMEKLDSIVVIKEQDNPFLTKALYLKAVIFVDLARQMRNPIDYDLILKEFRNKNAGSQYANFYTLAVQNLNIIVRQYPKDEAAPKALYFIGQIYDIDHLRAFGEAIDSYKSLIVNYPDSKERVLAEKRLNELNKIYEEIKGTPHGMGDAF